MGPRSGDRGNAALRANHPDFNWASMGPRSGDRGNPESLKNALFLFMASMGPRSGDRGNVIFGPPHGRREMELQWGRDLVIAEILGSSRSSWNTNQLQWGRDLVIAEINKYADVLTLPNLASMGPRSGDRGNERSSTEHAVCRLLQWGRDLVIAEMH